MLLLVHSCDYRKWLWHHWWRFFRASAWKIDVHFITGKELFSDQLIKALNIFKHEYLWYTLDDYWILKNIDWDHYEDLAINGDMDALRLQPNVQFDSLPYRFELKDGLFKQKPESAYTMSMQTSIWRREYFLECLEPGLDAWTVERTTPKLGDVYFVPGLPFWYVDTVRKGEIRKGMEEYFNV